MSLRDVVRRYPALHPTQIEIIMARLGVRVTVSQILRVMRSTS